MKKLLLATAFTLSTGTAFALGPQPVPPHAPLAGVTPQPVPAMRSTATAPVPAQSSGTINFSQVLKAINGQDMKDCDATDPQTGKCTKTTPMTLGRLAAAALSVPDRTASLTDQVKRGALAAKVVNGGTVSLDATDTKTIEDGIAKLGVAPFTVMEAVKIIDPAAVK